MQSEERNDRYLAKHGYGFGRIGGCSVEVLRTLNKEQIEAVLGMLLLGDMAEIGLDKDLLGHWAKNVHVGMPSEIEQWLQPVAALVYLTGHLAEDFEILTETKLSNDGPYATSEDEETAREIGISVGKLRRDRAEQDVDP